MNYAAARASSACMSMSGGLTAPSHVRQRRAFRDPSEHVIDLARRVGTRSRIETR